MKSFAVFAFLLACAMALVPAEQSCRKKEMSGSNKREGLTGGVLVFEDDFDRKELGPSWINRSGRWRIKDGRLYISGDRNRGLWLDFQLPERLRIEFDAMALSDDGDIKCEVFATEPRHQAGYIVILGGWKNTVSIIARLNEHGRDRMESEVKAARVKVHHFTVVSTDNTLRWYLDGELVLSYEDESPIRGPYFAFNDWVAPVWFDNLKIFAL